MHPPASNKYKTGDFRAMNTANLKLLKASPNPDKFFTAKSERIPSTFFDPLARKQSELKTAILLVDCLNSYVRNPPVPRQTCRQEGTMRGLNKPNIYIQTRNPSPAKMVAVHPRRKKYLEMKR